MCLPFVGDLLAREGGGRCHKQLAQRAIADLEIVRLAIAKRQTMVVANSSRSWKNEAKKRFAFRSSSSVGIILGHVEDQRPHLLASPRHRNVPNHSLQSFSTMVLSCATRLVTRRLLGRASSQPAARALTTSVTRAPWKRSSSVAKPLPPLSSLALNRRWKSAEPMRYEDYEDTPSEQELRYDLAVAHRLTARYNMDMLTWNHISHRFGDGCLITPGNKLFQDIRPEDLLVSSTNITADIIHAAVYEARPDVQAIIHVHTPAATAVSCLEEGFIPYTQDSAYFYNKVVRYAWDGLSNKLEEGPLLQAAVTSIPDCNTLLMDHHGYACFGKSVREAWVLAYYFERACEVQCRVMASGGTPKIPVQSVMQGAAADSYLPEFTPGYAEWDALCASVSFDD